MLKDCEPCERHFWAGGRAKGQKKGLPNKKTRHCCRGSVCYIGQPELYVETPRSCPTIESFEIRYLIGDLPDGESNSLGDLLLAPNGFVSVPEIRSDQLAAILYTSGTTARPKGVVHSHESLIQTALTMRQMGLDEDQIAVVMTSMSHLIGFGMIMQSGLINGATVVITRPFDFRATLEALERRRGTFLTGLPVMFRGLIQAQLEVQSDVPTGTKNPSG